MERGMLRLIVLSALSEKDHSGYSLIKGIKEMTGSKPSTGSVYPILIGLANGGCLTVKDIGRKRVYTITKKGRDSLKAMSGTKEQVIGMAVAKVKLARSVSSYSDINKILGDTIARLENLK